MRITAIIVAWNEATIMPFTMRHYSAFCDEVLVYDHHSTDGTADIVRSFPKGRVQQYDMGGELRDDLHTVLKSFAYRNQGQFAPNPPVSGDWFIMADADELLYHPDIRRYLEACDQAGITIPSILGWDMVSDTLPDPSDRRQIWEIVTEGIYEQQMGKNICIHKDAEILYAPGCHNACFGGRFKGGRCQGFAEHLRLLHFKWMSWPHVEKKLKNLRLSGPNMMMGWGTSLLDIPTQKARFETMLRERKRVLP